MTRRYLLIVPSAIVLLATNTALAQTPIVRITPDFQPNPLVFRGTSGGTQSSNCGNIAKLPSQVLQLTQPQPYLNLSVRSSGQPTLLINGPAGRFCVLADRFSQGNAEISGYWQAGKYSLYVGEVSPKQHSYTLSISRRNPPQK